MALLNGKTLIILRSSFLWTLAYFLLVDPRAVSGYSALVLFAQAMQLRLVEFSPNNPVVPILGAFLMFQGIADILPLSGDYLSHFDLIIPFRLCAYFALGAFCYLKKYALLSNSFVFFFSMVEITLNFFIYKAIREERNDNIAKQVNVERARGHYNHEE
ncbi:hypothetical protein NADFUDRAFT_50023 [Nadsonia fulvescens var. elongata DSM 6958]|uniref:Uncharacterized protein n=1 Tax=Nadsonia fulvescens var. elongata DSM 6958 TaxID=857566 RepID=A0A1E3PQ80_9ASCO|nr:hypothetical protein NADFUDRAFT_50023 [Nadsonia fulvescens var. elongata DSM 6958]